MCSSSSSGSSPLGARSCRSWDVLHDMLRRGRSPCARNPCHPRGPLPIASPRQPHPVRFSGRGVLRSGAGDAPYTRAPPAALAPLGRGQASEFLLLPPPPSHVETTRQQPRLTPAPIGENPHHHATITDRTSPVTPTPGVPPKPKPNVVMIPKCPPNTALKSLFDPLGSRWCSHQALSCSRRPRAW